MASITEKVAQKKMSRRTFLASTAACTAGLALTGRGVFLTSSDKNIASAAVKSEGKWITASCWHNCGGRCLNKAYVVDNIAIKQKTDDTHSDSPDYPQQRGCLRGRSQRHQCFGADRLKYPMKRKHWQPGGGDKSLRGKDEWERISWDEALDYVAAELKKAYQDHGPSSILIPNWGNESSKLCGLLGGYTGFSDTASFGTFNFDTSKYGFDCVGGWTSTFSSVTSTNDRLDLRNSETIILYGMNPASSCGGNAMYHHWQAKKAGAKFIFVGPEYNMSASTLEAKWIRVRPGTDTAFLLSVVYTMLKEDNPVINSIIDWDFLYRYTVGFDGEHLPADAKTTENLKDYGLGKYDGIPKTPEWATEISGTPVEDILYFARELRKDKKVAFLHSYAALRTNGSEGLPQLFIALGAMGGHFGKSGHCVGPDYHAWSFNGGPRLVNFGSNGNPYILNPLIDSALRAPTMWKSILEGKHNDTGNGHLLVFIFRPSVIKDIDIRVIWYDCSSALQTVMNVKEGIKANRKVDFVLASASQLTTSAKYADIVLPVTTQWERFGGFAGGTNREMLITYSQVTPPLYEAKDDAWIITELAKRLNIDPKKIYPNDVKQAHFNELAGATVVSEDSKSLRPLVTITDADIAEWGVQGKPQQGVIGLKELKEQGGYQVKRYPGDPYTFIGYEDYVKDPAKNPRPSQSGKFELYCQWKSDTIDAMKISEPGTYKPYPNYIRPVEGYEDTFDNWSNKEKGDYPYQVFNPHYLRRAHTAFDNIPQLREAFPNPVFINAQDAAEKGVKDGDTVLISSRYGQILRKASITETLMAGVIALPHGPWPDIDEKTGIDTNGNENVLYGSVTQGMGVSGYNTLNINFEKYKGTPIVDDDQKPQRIIQFN